VLTTLDRYVLGKLLRTFLPMTCGLCFVFFVGASFRLLREEDLSLAQVLLALPWVVPFLLPYLIPLAYTATLTFVFGRLVADNEVLAFGSLGIRARSLTWPALALALALTLFCSWLTAQVVPYCHQQKKEAARAVFQQLFDLGRGEHWSRTFPKQGFDLYVRRYEPGVLNGIVIHYVLRKDTGVTGSSRGLATQLVARTGRIAEESGTQRLVLVLEDVTVTLQLQGDPEALPTGDVELDKRRRDSIASKIGDKERDVLGAGQPVRLHLERYVQAIALGGRRRIKVTDYGSPALLGVQRRVEDRYVLAAATGGLTSLLSSLDETALEAEIELAQRANLALASFSITLVVLPLTLLLRSRNALVPFGLGLLATALCFFAPLLLGRSLAETFGSGAWVYLGTGVPLASGAFFAWLASRR
jgi:lipopolysaccharide export LptBFGC system permease protein LptF